MEHDFLIYTNDACVGNPGRAEIGYIIYQNPGQKLISACSYSPGTSTNN